MSINSAKKISGEMNISNSKVLADMMKRHIAYLCVQGESMDLFTKNGFDKKMIEMHIQTPVDAFINEIGDENLYPYLASLIQEGAIVPLLSNDETSGIIKNQIRGFLKTVFSIIPSSVGCKVESTVDMASRTDAFKPTELPIMVQSAGGDVTVVCGNEEIVKTPKRGDDAFQEVKNKNQEKKKKNNKKPSPVSEVHPRAAVQNSLNQFDALNAISSTSDVDEEPESVLETFVEKKESTPKKVNTPARKVDMTPITTVRSTSMESTGSVPGQEGNDKAPGWTTLGTQIVTSATTATTSTTTSEEKTSVKKLTPSSQEFKPVVNKKDDHVVISHRDMIIRCENFIPPAGKIPFYNPTTVQEEKTLSTDYNRRKKGSEIPDCSVYALFGKSKEESLTHDEKFSQDTYYLIEVKAGNGTAKIRAPIYWYKNRNLPSADRDLGWTRRVENGTNNTPEHKFNICYYRSDFKYCAVLPKKGTALEWHSCYERYNGETGCYYYDGPNYLDYDTIISEEEVLKAWDEYVTEY